MTPLRWETIERMRALFGTGLFREGVYFPSENELARSLDISRGTLRSVLRHFVQRGELVRGAGGRIMLKPMASPAGIGKGGYVHAWVHNPRDLAAVHALGALARTLATSEIGLRHGGAAFATTQRSEHQEREFLLAALDSWDCVGVVIWRDHRSAPMGVYAEIADRGLPAVFFDMPPPLNHDADFVGTAHQESAYRAVLHAITLGHRQIACLTHGLDTFLPALQRMAGYQEAMRRQGLSREAHVLAPKHAHPFSMADAEMMRGVDPPYDWWREQASLADDLIDQALSMAPRPTAVFTVYDRSATFLRQAAERRGVRIPDDLSVLAYSMQERETPQRTIEATGPVLDYEEIGVQVARQVLSRIHRQGCSMPCQLLLLPRFNEGSTLGPVPSEIPESNPSGPSLRVNRN